MGLGEIVGRSRQELTKRLERAGLPRTSRRAAAGVLTAAASLDRSRFFVGAVSSTTPDLVRMSAREAAGQTVAMAEAAGRGRFDLLGYQALSFGDPIDWHLDPVAGVRAPRVHWSRLPLQPAVIGDCKVVWELNRHQWLVTLAQAYRLTGDERHVAAFCRHVRDWLSANPPGHGVNWASSLEVALRLMSWCWALFLFRGAATLPVALVMDILTSIEAHATHVSRYLSHYFSPNTHLTGEALGLVYAGLLFPALPEARRWREQGFGVLVQQSGRQVRPDGVYFEQSTCYQRYTVEIYLHALILAARNGIPLPPSIAERTQAMLDFLLAVRCPDGSMPAIGDADGGWLLPLAVRAADDCRGVFSTAAAWFSRADYAWAAGGEPAPETLWLLGATGLTAFSRLTPAPPAGAPSRLFEHGGYAVMRSGWAPGAHHLVLDAGPLGCPVSGGHGHADLLSVQCAAFGRPSVVDPGTGCYTVEPEWRDFFRSTAAHSTVMVDGVGQAEPAGPFGWRQRPAARVLRWISTPE
ncbi:MAG: hypothetical protein DMD91_29220, partial [Candidatus Rokuibacteriota bacterium]